jgi:hypothetical protein
MTGGVRKGSMPGIAKNIIAAQAMCSRTEAPTPTQASFLPDPMLLDLATAW